MHEDPLGEPRRACLIGRGGGRWGFATLGGIAGGFVGAGVEGVFDDVFDFGGSFFEFFAHFLSPTVNLLADLLSGAFFAATEGDEGKAGGEGEGQGEAGEEVEFHRNEAWRLRERV